MESHPKKMNVPRLFWPLALTLAGLLAAALLVEPVAKMFTDDSKNYNEGWNAYHQQEAAEGRPLYGAPPVLTGNNYPPISFHVIGLVSRLTGDVNQTGRWAALISLLLVAVLCGAIVRRFTHLTPLAAYTALSVVIWMGVYKPDRIGTNDPQLLGTVFSLLGLYAYIRGPEKLRWLCISAVAFTVSVFTKHNLLAFPTAVGCHMLLHEKWKASLTWGAVIAGGSAVLLALTYWIDGSFFLVQILMPRPRTIGFWRVAIYLSVFQLPVALAVVWSLRRGTRSLGHVMVLALIAAHVLVAIFAGGNGVDSNIFFDCVFALAIVSSLVFAEYAPLLAVMDGRSFLLTALLVAPLFGILIGIPGVAGTLIQEKDILRALPSSENQFDAAVNLLKTRPGPALCEDLLLCFDAGKPFTYDAYFADDLVKAGRMNEEALVSLVATASFSTVEIDLEPGETTLHPGARHRFPAKFIQALLDRYRVEAKLGNSVLLVPRG